MLYMDSCPHLGRNQLSKPHKSLCIFEGKMDGPLFPDILEISLVPFLKHVYFDLHCFVQGNDHKRCSKIARKYYPGRGINWWPTTLESPDLTPNKNLMSSQILTGSSLEFSKRQSPLASAIFACEKNKNIRPRKTNRHYLIGF